MDNQKPVTNQPPAEPAARPAGDQAPRPAGDRPPRPAGERRPERPMGGPREGRGPRRFGPPPRRYCIFCKDPNKKIDYKNGDMLRRYLTERGKIRPRRKIGTCARHQRQLSLAIKRARHLALLPYAPEHIRGG
ncbi:MAG: 30S ribosomal protein S18 [Rudaea sp.]